MDKFNLLAELADGMLDNEQEAMLYSEMAVNEELRSEFKQLLSFNSAIKNNRGLFSVDGNSTNAIFSAIGIPLAGAVTASVGAASASGKVIGNIGLFTAKYAQAIMGASFATLTTAALFLLFFKPFNVFNDEYSNNNFHSKNNVALKSDSAANNSSTPIVNSNIIDENDSNKNIKYIYIDRPIYIEKSDISENLPVAISNTNKVLLNFSKDETVKISVNSREFQNFAKVELPEIDLNQSNYEFATRGDNKIEFELKSSQHWNMPTETITPSKIAEFNNTSISGLYNYDQNFSVGFDVRQETFFQKFQGSDKMGQLNVYEQQPNFTSYSLILRYGYNIFDNFKPIAQVTIGGTNVGFIGRFMTGMQYKFNDELRFLLGIEYSNLFYNYQNTSFNSPKIGINYGISYSF